ncbi:MAG: dihydropteroate synthase [Bacteroides sp.]|nr:dihydropteroate synthase [Bacteroides sp.]MCM1412803.1 dihydropteroate synthase [Bacteroides sp.]MCM1470903.1 dihydropteroate synthase [Bacteroides sp.]
MNEFRKYTLRLGDRLLSIDRPQVMGIVNVTPDSFFGGSRAFDADSLRRRVEHVLESGADMIDLGGYSSRPGADDVSPEEEMRRVALGMEVIRRLSADVPVSIDTFRSAVAREAIVNCGADIINDISGGDLDSEMFNTVAQLNVPYILMHMRGCPADMQTRTGYDDIVGEVTRHLAERVDDLHARGVSDVIVDPGFGFSKTVDQSFQLLCALDFMTRQLDCPMLIGVSRKTMIWKTLGVTADEALNGTTCINTIALMQGASILRVHDVAEAVEAVKLTQKYFEQCI